MNDAPELIFHETMSGPLALGLWDPLHGEHAGHSTPLTLHSSLRIDSLEDFLRDPRHEARLGGQVSFAPFGEHLPILHGSFHLFSPTEDPGMRLMRYSVTFMHAGREYFLAGTKFLQSEPRSNLWLDTTRLHTTLHEGPDARGQVVGAGVLTIDVLRFLRLLASLRAPGGGVRPLARFGRFFLGNLWELYVRPPAPWPGRRLPSPLAWD
jgi:hypothetical protein